MRFPGSRQRYAAIPVFYHSYSDPYSYTFYFSFQLVLPSTPTSLLLDQLGKVQLQDVLNAEAAGGVIPINGSAESFTILDATVMTCSAIAKPSSPQSQPKPSAAELDMVSRFA